MSLAWDRGVQCFTFHHSSQLSASPSILRRALAITSAGDWPSCEDQKQAVAPTQQLRSATASDLGGEPG